VDPVTGMAFVRLPGGLAFDRGVVQVSPFYLGRFEVTQAQWHAVMGSNPAHFKGPDRPVERVSWQEAKAFAERLSMLTGNSYRLPTRAEWWYAATAEGDEKAYQRFYWKSGNRRESVWARGWYAGNSGGQTHHVGRKEPNQFGLYDMEGNVWEWCLDTCDPAWNTPDRDRPEGEALLWPVYLGDSWGNAAGRPRTLCRYPPDVGSAAVGFRLVMEAPEGTARDTAATPSEPLGLGEAPKGLDFVLVQGGRFYRGAALDRGWLGLTFGGAASAGVTVASVVAGGPAAAAGIRPGDAIVRLGGEPIDSSQELVEFLDLTTPELELEVRFLRGARAQTVTATLGMDERKGLYPVILSDFHLGAYEVTQAQWQAVMGANPSYFQGSNHPVENVSWNEVQAFIRKLNESTGEAFRLPTEAEWEYAARGGGRIQTWSGTSRATELVHYAWLRDASTSRPRSTQPVGRKRPNRLGLYDMTGNVAEFCQDWHHAFYFKRSRLQDPAGPPGPGYKVFGGGSWFWPPQKGRNGWRQPLVPEERRGGLVGFRLAATRLPAAAGNEWQASGLARALRVRLVAAGTGETGHPQTDREPVDKVPVLAENPPHIVDPVTGMEFVFVPGGGFDMGDNVGLGEPDELPVHRVTVADFYLARTPVTQAQWNQLMATDPSLHRGPDRPVHLVEWDRAQEFVGRLNELSGKAYRLPTEAEWEYAARSGGKNEIWAGTSAESELGEHAWYRANATEGPLPKTVPGLTPGHAMERQRAFARDGFIHAVGRKKPNGLGLYDMNGNIWEWCFDWYDETYYARSPADNPQGPARGQKHVIRGGN
jgi:formylglycine-generating enzyme required for sulfatase activity